jgi:hypothetical protein
VKDEILPFIAETTMCNPLHKFAYVDSDCSGKAPPLRVGLEK